MRGGKTCYLVAGLLLCRSEIGWANEDLTGTKRTFDLHQVILLFLAKSARPRLNRQEVEVRLGLYERASSIYDTTLAVEMELRPELYLGTREPLVLNRLVPSFSLTKKTRHGVNWSVGVYTAVRLGNPDDHEVLNPTDRLRFNQGLYGTLTLPLLRSWNPTVSAAPEIAARYEYQASVATSQDQTANDLKTLVESFWTLVAIQHRLEIAKQSQLRAERLLAEARVLIRADERPKSDASLFEAALSEKRAQTKIERINRHNEHQRLFEALGVPDLPVFEALGELPAVPRTPPDLATAVNALLSRATSSPLLAALRLKEEATKARALFAEDQKGADLQLNADVRISRDDNEFFRDTTPGANSSAAGFVNLSYTWPVGRQEQIGLARQRSAEHQRATLARRVFQGELEHRIVNSMAQAILTITRYQDRSEVVLLYKRSVEDEKERFRLGLATTIDVLQVEDRYTSALFQQINDHLAYAKSITDLLYQVGAIDVEQIKNTKNAADLFLDLSISSGASP